MITLPQELIAVLRQYNPWWSGMRVPDLPEWRRAAFRELELWLRTPPAPRAVLLSGARQVGKTTLLLQAVESLVASGVPPQNILYATFDHPLLKLAGLDGTLKLWREFESAAEGPEYLLLDEIQFMRDWQTWLKLQVDFHKNRRIIVTGSATPLTAEGQESGVGRWHTIKLATLSFFEYLQLKKITVPPLPEVASLTTLFRWSPAQFVRAGDIARPLIPHFHEYLMRGGFPQCALVASVDLAQKLLREDIVDKVLKRDMTALFGVRRVLELEQTFLYLCLHDGGLLDVQDLCRNLEVKKPTATSFISLLEATHLIHRLPPYGYGKEILRARHKVYLADAAIAPSVLLKGKAMLQDAVAVGRAVETAFFKHVFTRYYDMSVGFSYWRGKRSDEVDIVADVRGRLVPFEIKYRHHHTDLDELKGIIEFCTSKKISRGYVVTRGMEDFTVVPLDGTPASTRLLKIPALLACYWLGQSELLATRHADTED
ncbi:MAG: ATP-binding protein [Nitrospirota bacterium]